MPYLAARRRARGATVAFLLPAAVLARSITVLGGLDGAAPVAVLPFLALCGLCVVGWFVLGRLWRRVGDLRPVTLSIEAGDGALQGTPERDGASGSHLSLSGEVAPPTRW
ncbi:hypothetical protein [uncultured Cellulomonas sp.]|uniref:hypothetical protein n=1 Tax=uncultured Cellulomonas sp. TaxID=189682 RepID=UPI0028F126B2|nr:hypothetical protein [uncultured Cellulomonas sp.]